MAKIREEFLDSNYVSGSKSVGTTEVLACVSTSNMAGREVLYIENLGPQKVYYGPTGISVSNSAELAKGQYVKIKANEKLNIYVIAAQTDNTVIIQEIS